MQSTRVAFVHLAFEDYSAAIINELHSLVDLTVFHPESLADRMRDRLSPDVTVETFAKPRFRDPRNIVRMPGIIRRLESFDVVHVQQSGDPWFDLALTALRRPKVITVHDVVPHSGDGDRIPGSYAARRVMHRTADAFIVHTDEMKHELREQTRPDQPVRVVSIPAMRSVWIGDRQPHPTPANRHEVLFFGRIWPYKGLDLLVDAMSSVRQSVPTARLVVAGRGADLDELFGGGPPDWVDLHDRFIDHDEIAVFFERAAVVALPYRDATQSAVGVMAIDFRRPAVASAVGGLQLLFDGERGANLVPPADVPALADALIALLTDDDLWAQRQRELDERFDVLDPASVARATAALYDELV